MKKIEIAYSTYDYFFEMAQEPPAKKQDVEYFFCCLEKAIEEIVLEDYEGFSLTFLRVAGEELPQFRLVGIEDEKEAQERITTIIYSVSANERAWELWDEN